MRAANARAATATHAHSNLVSGWRAIGKPRERGLKGFSLQLAGATRSLPRPPSHARTLHPTTSGPSGTSCTSGVATRSAEMRELQGLDILRVRRHLLRLPLLVREQLVRERLVADREHLHREERRVVAAVEPHARGRDTRRELRDREDRVEV